MGKRSGGPCFHLPVAGADVASVPPDAAEIRQALEGLMQSKDIVLGPGQPPLLRGLTRDMLDVGGGLAG